MGTIFGHYPNIKRWCLMSGAFKKLETDKLCRQSIQAYLDLEGIPYTQDNHYLKLQDHDSLVVDTRILPGKPYETFYWNSRGEGGNLYNFLKVYQEMSSSEAMETLKRISPNLVKHHAANHFEKAKPYEGKNLPVTEPLAAREYLIKVRKLSPKFVDILFKKGLARQIKSNPPGDILFSWRDHTMNEVGGDIQGSYINHEKYGKRGTKKKILGGSKRQFGFNFRCNTGDGPQRLYIFESPIDALSYCQLHGKKYHGKQSFLSLNGSGSKVATIPSYMKEFGVPSEVHLCLDMDQAGVKGIKKANDLLLKLKHQYPDVFGKVKVYMDLSELGIKDWNEALKQGNTNLKSVNLQNAEKRKPGLELPSSITVTNSMAKPMTISH